MATYWQSKQLFNPMHTTLQWLQTNVFGNLIANVLWEVPLWLLAMWRFERRHKRHQKQIQSQIIQTLASFNDKSNT